ncbi:uncharacterized protein L203_105261 [Cryptococcus depauperatus CBS 7841]|uniref:Glycosyltransferase family 28 N-terminal domain-containing protein n=1 Tax=Cryptococcus depauperatus CBS 7841 TaxID=1295531 RepID=A0AAJ8JX35_9TREE
MSRKAGKNSEIPFYLQNESGSATQIILPAVEDDPTVSSSESAIERRKREKKEAKIGIKRVKVGKVEIDPNIDYADFTSEGPGLDSRAVLDGMGMINIWVNLKKPLPDLPQDYMRPVREWGVDKRKDALIPALNVVIFIVGSRGDVQPYISLALHLIINHDHSVRIATHSDFKDFVLSSRSYLKGKVGRDGKSLEEKLSFFDVGGNPKELMAYMVKNPGLLPGIASLTNGDVASKRRMARTLLHGFYLSTFSPDQDSGKEWAADAIISNPPAFAHVHIAEGLGLPLLMSFTMPWSPTTAFNHPLVNVKQSNAEKGLTNYLTFALAELLTWQGLGDVINEFRQKTLRIAPLNLRSGPSLLDRLKIPWTYCWSEGLIEKPNDWMEHIDISGFYFLPSDENFQPKEDLKSFLANGSTPIYIGFGSVVVDDAVKMTEIIFQAVRSVGVRAIVSAGWGGLGRSDVPNEIFVMKDNVPHDWLFSQGRVAAVCHHGGAGTTAIGVKNGLPTIVVPFFGDQAFWGQMIYNAGAGPTPIPQKMLCTENLAEAIRFALSPAARKAAEKMAKKINSEKGEVKGVDSFHKHLPLRVMRCEVDPNRVALWWSDDLCLRLSGLAAAMIVESGKINWKDLEPHRSKEYDSRRTISDPVTGGASAIFSTITNYYSGIAQIFYNPPKGVINTAIAIPKGMMNIITSISEGMDNIPNLIGSTSRPRGEVKDFGSGVTEAAKGVFYGYWDGITGLVTEPIKGGKKEGFLGTLKGMGRSYVNVTAKPAAGIIGAISLPLQGASRSIRTRFSTPQDIVLCKPRKALSVLALKNLSEVDKANLEKRFGELADKRQIIDRQQKLRKRAEKVLRGNEDALNEDEDSSSHDS